MIIVKQGSDNELKLTGSEFVAFYYEQFGYNAASPRALLENMTDSFTYLGKGYSVRKIDLNSPKTEAICSHPRKYLNKLTKNLEFTYCPDCKKEVE